MINVSQIIDDVKEEFEGGNSLAVNWDIAIRKGAKTAIRQARPETMKRTVPIYGGLADNISAYYCPDDVLVPSKIFSNNAYNNNRITKYLYRSPKSFFEKEEYNTFTIDYINGVRFIYIRHSQAITSLTVDEMEAVGTKTGGSPTLNSHNYILGSYSIEATFTDAGVEFGDDCDLDITDYLKGVAILPAYISDATKLSSIEIRFKTDDSNYYSISSTADSIGNYITNGWNMIKFEMQNLSTTGAPDSADINEWSIIGTTTTGNSITIQFDKFTLQKSNPFYFEYYSSAPFVSGSTGALWQSTVNESTNDKVNFNDDMEDILHYEVCMKIIQSSTFENVDGQASTRFTAQLQRAYDAYWEDHPSTEQPISYNIGAEVSKGDETDYVEDGIDINFN